MISEAKSFGVGCVCFEMLVAVCVLKVALCFFVSFIRKTIHIFLCFARVCVCVFFFL